MNSQPTVFHITHQKAGSQWVAEVLKHCASQRYVQPKIDSAHFLKDPLKPGAIYPTVYVAKPEFEQRLAVQQHIQPEACIKFVVIRDLRDAVVSRYFSWKISHPVISDFITRNRAILNRLNKEAGLLYLIEDERSFLAADIHMSWINDGALLIKYEELVEDDHAVFERIIDYCGIDVSRKRLREIIRYNTFEAVTGRKRGQEDVNAHQRKGIVGDWSNHFTEQIKESFKQHFGGVLIKTGYENNFLW